MHYIRCMLCSLCHTQRLMLVYAFLKECISCLQEAKGVASGSNGRGAANKKGSAKAGTKRRARVPKEQKQHESAEERWGISPSPTAQLALFLCGIY